MGRQRHFLDSVGMRPRGRAGFHSANRLGAPDEWLDFGSFVNLSVLAGAFDFVVRDDPHAVRLSDPSLVVVQPVRPSVRPFIRLSGRWYVCLSVCLSICPANWSTCLSVRHDIRPSAYAQSALSAERQTDRQCNV
jgi:hypothetical protein